MRDKVLYTQILDVYSPWQVSEVDPFFEANEARVFIEPELEPICDSRRGEKTVRAMIGAVEHGGIWIPVSFRRCRWRCPRVECSGHSAATIDVLRAEPGSGFSALFEALVVDRPMEASILAFSKQLGLSKNAIDGIMRRAVRRRLEQREKIVPERIGVNESSFCQHHDYVWAVSDQGGETVLPVVDCRSQESLSTYYDTPRKI